MYPRIFGTWLALAGLLLATAGAYQVPGLDYPAQVREEVSILPGGRVLKPFGRTILTGNAPFAIAVSPSGKTIVTANIGISPATGIQRPSITTIAPGKKDAAWALTDFAAEPRSAKGTAWQGLATGLAITAESSAWVSEGDSGRVVELNLTTGGRKVSVSVGGIDQNRVFTGPLSYDSSRNLLAVVERVGQRVVIVDAKRGVVLGSVKTGAPGAVAWSPDGKRLYVTHAGAASLTIVDTANPAEPKVSSEVPLGPSGQTSGIAVNQDQVYVSLVQQDSVAVVNGQTGKFEGEIPLRIPGLEEYRGITPLGLAWDSKSKRLLVAEAGINAVGVLDPAGMRVLGHLPVGWFPSAIAIHEGQVYVASSRGVGTGPSSPAQRIRMVGGGRLMAFQMETSALRRGTVNAFTVPDDKELAAQTDVVMQANGFLRGRSARVEKAPPPVKFVVLIERGNHSFDEILGDVDRAGDRAVLGDASYARHGMNGYVSGGKTRFSLHVGVTPNHHAIAERWAFADNYYADSDFPAAGHRWLTGGLPDLVSETGWLYREAGNRSPVEIPAEGPLWEHLTRNKIEFRRFPGEGSASDQQRADEFVTTMRKEYLDAGKAIPQLLWIHLPGELQGASHPDDGLPYDASRIAVSDYSLGRVIEFLSRTPWWKEMAVFVAGTGAEGSADHVDSHRTLLLGAGPWFRTNYVSHTNSSAPSLLRTMFRIFGIPPMNLYDATAGDLMEMFGAVPDYAPFELQPEDPRLFDK